MFEDVNHICFNKNGKIKDRKTKNERKIERRTYKF